MNLRDLNKTNPLWATFRQDENEVFSALFIQVSLTN